MASGHQIRMGKFRLVFLDDPDDGVAAVAGLHVDNTPRLARRVLQVHVFGLLSIGGPTVFGGVLVISLTEPAQIAWIRYDQLLIRPRNPVA